MPNASPADAPPSNARLGLVLFVVYLVAYGGFMGLCAFSLPTLKPTLGGVNWAVVYGLALIVGAFLLAVLYMLLCRDGGKDAS